MAISFDKYPVKKDFYKIVAVDMDGTLLSRQKTIGTLTKQVLRKAQDAGMAIVIETGRSPSGVMRYASDIGIDLNRTYGICYNGAGVFEFGHGKELSAVTKPGSMIKEIASLAHSMGAKVHGYTQDRALLVEDHNPYAQKEIDHSLSPYEEVDFATIPDDEPFYKLIATGEAPILDALRAAVPQHIHDNFTVVRTNSYFLEFVANRSNKGTGLQQLCKLLNIDIKYSMAFGDEENDLEMLQMAGLSVAMGNASAQVKAIADVVTKSCDEDGVAVFLQRFL